MLKPVYTKQFERDLKRVLRRGKDPEKFKVIIRDIINQNKLSPQYKDHKLSGNYKDRRECHIEPDWLLIYKPENERVIFERMGSHADLFK